MITPRPDQEAASEALVDVNRGIVKAPAGSGKTIIAALAIAKWLRKRKGIPGRILWLAHTEEQLQQGYEAAMAVNVHTMPDSRITFQCYQSGGSALGFDLVICDECHHIAAPEYRKIVDTLVGGTIWGFSATPDRADDLKDDVYELIGPIVYTIERKGLVDSGKLLGAKVFFHAPNKKDEFKDFVEGEAAKGFEKMKYSLNHVAGQLSRRSVGDICKRLGVLKEAIKLGVDPDDPMSAVPSPKKSEWLRAAAKLELMSRARWHACQTYGVFENERRNTKIEVLANNDVFLGNSVLILVGSIEHGKLLQKQIGGAVVVYSKMGAKKRKAAIAGFRDGTIKCAIATSLADEGLDVPRANVLILAAAGRSEGKTEQRSGRVLRAWAEQTHGVIHDFWDQQHPMLMNQSRVRAKVYHGLGYQFAGGAAIQVAIRAIGIKIHPLLDQTADSATARTPRKSGAVSSDPILLPVPVLAESNISREVADIPRSGPACGDGEARESTCPHGEMPRDSRGGQKPPLLADYYHPVFDGPTCAPGESGVSSPASKFVEALPLNTHLDVVATTGCKASVETVEERKHAKLSPSALKAKSICSGFISDPTGDHKASERGTLGHKAVESENPDLCKDDKTLRAAVEKCLAYKKTMIPGRTVLQEVKFPYFEQWGFCDLIAIKKDHARLLDWKFAYNFYEADSPQFWAYSLGAWDMYPRVETIEVHVIHPFLDALDVKVFTRTEHYSEFQVKIKGVMAKVYLNRPEDYVVTGQCAWCGFAGECSKLAEIGVKVGQRYANKIEIPEDTNFHGSAVTDPNIMGLLVRLAPIVKKAAGGWGKAALKMWDSGVNIPGVKEARKGGRREKIKAAVGYQIIKEHFIQDLSPELFLANCEVPATALDKIVSEGTARGGKKDAVKYLAAYLEDEDALGRGAEGRFLVPLKQDEEDDDESA